MLPQQDIDCHRGKTAKSGKKNRSPQKEQTKDAVKTARFCKIAETAENHAEKESHYERIFRFPVKQEKKTGQKQQAHILEGTHGKPPFRQRAVSDDY